MRLCQGQITHNTHNIHEYSKIPIKIAGTHTRRPKSNRERQAEINPTKVTILLRKKIEVNIIGVCSLVPCDSLSRELISFAQERHLSLERVRN